MTYRDDLESYYTERTRYVHGSRQTDDPREYAGGLLLGGRRLWGASEHAWRATAKGTLSIFDRTHGSNLRGFWSDVRDHLQRAADEENAV